MGAGGFFEATGGRDDKLVSGKNQLGWEIFARRRECIVQQTRAALLFGGERFRGSKDFDDVPFFRRTDQRRRVRFFKIDMKKSRAPQVAFVVVTAALLGAINHLANLSGGNGEGGLIGAQFHADGRQTAAAG